MPVQYRTFYLRKLINIKEREQREWDRVSSESKASTSNSNLVRGPGINRN